MSIMMNTSGGVKKPALNSSSAAAAAPRPLALVGELLEAS